MSGRTNKLVSLGLATVAIVYGCYPYVSGARPETQPAEGKRPRLSARLLSPDLPPVSQVDPFRIPPATPKTVAQSTPIAKAATVKREFDPKAVLAGLTLEATTILGTERFAMINGRVYAEGATLPTGQADSVPAVLARVERERVLLRADGHMLELRYPHQTAGRAAGRRSGVRGTQAGGPSSRTDRRKR